LIHPLRSEAPVLFGSLGTVALTLSVGDLDRMHRRLSEEGWIPLSPCLDLKPPGGKPVRAFCVPVEPGVLLELIEEERGGPSSPC
ncbi:MAG: hypothetical protein K9M82_10365, partial [Deltaproteobacteria bacterium]|nr:hypothetical protein [Deltaproteobacteria bacterium]